MDDGKYIRELSDGELMRMLGLDRDRYTKQEIAIAEDEARRRKQAKPSSKPSEPAPPEAPAAPARPEAAQQEPAGTDEGVEAAESLPADVEELIRSLSIESLHNMVNVQAGRYSQPQLDVALDEIGKRERMGEEAEAGPLEEPEASRTEPAGEDEGETDEGEDDEDWSEEGEGGVGPMRSLSNEALFDILKNARAGTHTRSEVDAAAGELNRRGKTKVIWTGKAVWCPWCGKEMQGDAKYCMECGRKMDGEGRRRPGQPGMRVVIGVVLAFVVFTLIAMSAMCR